MISLLFRFFILSLALTATAGIELRTARQNYSVSSLANGYSGTGEFILSQESTRFGADITASRSIARSASAPRGNANASIVTAASLDGSIFQFSVNSSGAASSSYSSAPVTFSGLGMASLEYRQVFEFDVLETSETVTVSIASIVLTTNGGNRVTGPILYADATPIRGTRVVENSNTANGKRSRFFLTPGSYRLELVLLWYFSAQASFADQSMSVSASAAFGNTVEFPNLVFVPGSSQENPVLPPGGGGGGGAFPGTARGAWVDPPAVSEFSFQMMSNSLFTGIMTFPSGFTNDFEVVAEGASLGFFNTNQSVDFVELLGQGVSAFKVRNIAPLVDGSDPRAFPIQLDFNTPTADFVMLPNPGVAIVKGGETGGALLYFAGALEHSTNTVDWTGVPGATNSPIRLSRTNIVDQRFFRARQ